MTRAKGFASPEIVTRCIEIMKRLDQPTVGLNHYGESLLHPEFLAIVAKFNASSIKPWVYTNGDFLPHIVADLAKMKLHSLVISGHAPQDERAKLAEQCTSLGLPASWQRTVADNCVDIAGQVSIPGHASTSVLKNPSKHCRFLRDEMAIILWNGDLVPCCFDYDGKAVFGNVLDPIEEVLKLAPKPSALCDGCPGPPGNIV